MRVRAALEEQESITELRRNLPILLNYAESFATAQREARHRQEWLDERVARAEQRLEFVRREILFEMRRGHARDVPAEDVLPRIVHPGKVAGMGDDLRLNLGCGHLPLEGYVNVDARELDGVDVVADAGSLPFEPDSVAAIHSAHLLEHFPIEDLTRMLLPYWFSLLSPGGTFSAVVPDAETMLAEHAAGRMSFDDLRRVTYGEQEYEGNFHFNMFSQAMLCDLLRDTGFVNVALGVTGRRNGYCYEMEVRATKPARTVAREPAPTA